MPIELYQQYQDARKITEFDGRNMEYEWGSLPQKLSFTWLLYSQMFDEFSSEIANTINQLTEYRHRLKTWNMVITGMDEKQKMNATHEFIEPLAIIALNLPYVIRSRFIFATAHLCHQANRSLELLSWKDDLPLDSEIYFKDADKYGANWKPHKKLKLALEKIAAKGYTVGTRDFRHSYNHRFCPRIVIGMTEIVTRHIDKASGKTSYVIGGKPALALDVIIDLLTEQCISCYTAFDAFQKLVREHEASISSYESQRDRLG